MPLKYEDASKLRIAIQNEEGFAISDPKNKDKHIKKIHGHFLTFTGINEEGYNQAKNGYKISTHVYRDSKGIPTIGVGFCLGKDGDTRAIAGARKELCDALGLSEKDFNALRAGKKDLTADQCNTLFSKAAKKRNDFLCHTVFGQETWNKFHPNEQMSMISMCYNCPALLYAKNKQTGKFAKTTFAREMEAVITASDRGDKKGEEAALNRAQEEVLFRSNREASDGLLNRRIAEAEGLNTFDRDLTSKINEAKALVKAKQFRRTAVEEVESDATLVALQLGEINTSPLTNKNPSVEKKAGSGSQQQNGFENIVPKGNDFQNLLWEEEKSGDVKLYPLSTPMMKPTALTKRGESPP